MNAAPGPIVFMFSGQGGQYRNMGRCFFENDPEFAHCFKQGAAIIREICGFDAEEILYVADRRPQFDLKKTLWTHPCIFVVQYALAKTLMARGVRPDALIGLSLGEYVAAVVAGAIDFESMLRLVCRQAQIIEEVCEPGALVTVLASRQAFPDVSPVWCLGEFAGENFPEEFTLAVPLSDLRELEWYLKREKITHAVLPVSHGFHSKYIAAAGENFMNLMEAVPLAPLKLNYVSCSLGAESLRRLPPRHFWEIVRTPLRSRETLQRLDPSFFAHATFIDLGPSGTMGALIKRNQGPHLTANIFAIMSPWGREQENLERVLRPAVRAQ